MEKQKASPLLSIQYLRAIAAMMVVAFHARNPEKWLFNPLDGTDFLARGVDIFFIISGFIMYVSGRNQGPMAFMARRVVRIAPLYWLATLASAGYIHYFRYKVLPLSLGLSLAFIPFFNPAHHGAIWPVLVPGWTLNFEMFFYVLFALGLALNRLESSLSVIIITLVTAGLLFDFGGAIAKTYTDMLMLEFLAGFWIARYWLSHRNMFRHLWPLLPIGLILFPVLEGAGLSPIICGFVPALAVVLGALAIEARGRTPDWSTAKLLGDASYSIYISHTMTMIVSTRIMRSIPLEGWPQFFAMMGFSIFCALVVGIAVYRWVEKPLLRLTMPLTRLPIFMGRVDKPDREGPSAA